jgi:hypothetical protein
MEFKENAHLDPALTDPATRTLNADKLIGRWRNTNTQTRGIAEITIKERAGKFTVTASGVGSDGPIPWPPAQALALANLEEEAGQRAVALAVNFDFDFMTVETYLRVNKGVLVIVLFVTFRDDSGRSNYVNREFFYRHE